MFRKQLIEHLKQFAIHKRLAFCTLHLAVYLMDIFMDNHAIKPNKLLLVANVSILLAAKLEESHFNIPLIEQLNDAVTNEYSNTDYERLQLMMLEFFNWSIFFPTAAYYTHYFLQAAIDQSDLEETGKTYREMVFALQECVVTFLDKTIDGK